MLLPIFLISILASTNAGWLDGMLDLLPKLNPLDRVPDMPDLLTPPEDATLTTMELISKYGYDGELHNVTTADGYILEVHRIKGRANSTTSNVQKPVVFVMHGLLCDSSVWVISGREKSLAFILADEGYDVWLGNARGNRYAQTHTHKKIKAKDYWSFSWHEIGTQDLPAMIDHVVNTTGLQKMFYLGHSQGTTAFFVMASERPEYQKYFEEVYAMAPMVYCGRMKSPFLQLLSQFTTGLDYMWNMLGAYEFNPNNEFTKAIQHLVCAENAISQPICSNAIFLLAGFNAEQFDPAILPAALGHVPSTTATKQLIHYGQLIKSGTFLFSGKFKKFDYGTLGNKNVYGTWNPPNYNLSRVTAPIHLYYSENDWLANVQDVEKLHSELTNPTGLTLIDDENFNHVDYMWAKDVKTLVYDQIISTMKKKSS
ncbi:PREDICTED: lipase 3-like [Vollenhovia emeryi]|uniref:lipase 3-like n=1 Tax=Vollenhovia emeryi TaxID=411798 RepID=UPI0005F454BF|nr:PREDICTED: lipase 3-like [Vollenhovia emeryi]